MIKQLIVKELFAKCGAMETLQYSEIIVPIHKKVSDPYPFFGKNPLISKCKKSNFSK